MEVTFFRHGIAVDRADPLAPVDFERPLSLEGKHKAEEAARGLRALDLHPMLVLTSPYRRCVQTARLVGQAFGLPKKSIVEVDCLGPEADPRTVWTELERLQREAILCVGHGGKLEPVAGIALGLPTRLPDSDPAAPELALATLHLKKTAALHLDVSFSPQLTWPWVSPTTEDGEPHGDSSYRSRPVKPPQLPPDLCDGVRDPLRPEGTTCRSHLTAHLMWLLSPKILRQLGRR